MLCDPNRNGLKVLYGSPEEEKYYILKSLNTASV